MHGALHVHFDGQRFHNLMKSHRGLWPKRLAEKGSYTLEGEQELEAGSRKEPGLSTLLPLCISEGQYHPHSHCEQASPHASSHSAGASHMP